MNGIQIVILSGTITVINIFLIIYNIRNYSKNKKFLMQHRAESKESNEDFLRELNNVLNEINKDNQQ